MSNHKLDAYCTIVGFASASITSVCFAMGKALLLGFTGAFGGWLFAIFITWLIKNNNNNNNKITKK